MIAISIKMGLQLMDQETYMKEVSKFMGGDFSMGFGGEHGENMVGLDFQMPDFSEVAQRILGSANRNLDRLIERASGEEKNQGVTDDMWDLLREFFN